MTVEANSAFEAMDKATDAWSRFWWFDPSALVIVQRGEQRWSISQARVREWREKKRRGVSVLSP